jgi:hypothetical protein
MRTAPNETIPHYITYLFGMLIAASTEAEPLFPVAPAPTVLDLTFDVIVSQLDPRVHMAVGRSVQEDNALCLIADNPHFGPGTFEYLDCHQGFDLEAGMAVDGGEADFYLDANLDSVVGSALLLAPGGIKAMPGRRHWELRRAIDDGLEEMVPYSPSMYPVGSSTFLVRSRAGHFFKVSLDNNAPYADLGPNAVVVLGLTFSYEKADSNGRFPN